VRYAILSLSTGWNQIATPFSFAIEWDHRLEFPEVIQNVLHRYQGASAGYDNPAILQPAAGYFVRANAPADLWLPYEEFVSGGKSGEAPFEATIDHWRLALRLQAGDLVDRSCTLGAMENAEAGFDDQDHDKPPYPGERYLSLTSLIENEAGEKRSLGGDFRGPSAELGWSYDLVARGGNLPGNAVLTLPSTETLPAGFSVAVIDPYTGRNLPLTAGGSFRLPGGLGDAGLPFTLLVGDKSWVEGQEGQPSAVPQAYSLAQNFPNPFNPSTEISFDLPRSSEVVIDIYDVAGHRVRTLVDESLPAGRHSVFWLGEDERGQRVSSGVYFYRLRADGEQWIKRMTLVK